MSKLYYLYNACFFLHRSNSKCTKGAKIEGTVYLNVFPNGNKCLFLP